MNEGMSTKQGTSVRATGTLDYQMRERPGDPCIVVIFGASGDLTKRLLLPAIYNLACDKLLPERLAIVGLAMDGHATESFRESLANATT
jgi:glucose-6-phosphate 1-dehydrogenase